MLISSLNVAYIIRGWILPMLFSEFKTHKQLEGILHKNAASCIE